MMRSITLFLTVAMVAGLTSISQGAPSAPDQLRCEGLANPLGIDQAKPRLSWAIPPGARGLAQSAYQVLVTDSSESLAAEKGTLWDSGKVTSDQSQWVPYTGKPLGKGSQCWWKVRVWDQNGAVSPWSKPAFFSVGPLSASDWKGEWIGADWMKDHEGPLPWLRKTFTLNEVPTTATAYVCALGYFELYVNGKKVGDDVLVPAVSDYGKRGLYLTYDISKYLHKGKNCIALWLGRGWSLGVLKNTGNVGPMVKADVDLSFNNAAPMTIVTDATWKAHPSNIIPLGRGPGRHDRGERIEAAKMISDWNATNYDDSTWKAATVHHPPTPIIAAQMMEPNRVLDEITVKSIKPLDDGSYLIDMGRNYTGWFQLDLPDDVKPGTEIVMSFADCQLPNGKYQTFGQQSEYVAKGGGNERFRNHFNYEAFRYAIVKGLPRAPKPEEVKGWLVTTNFKPNATFSCDNPLLNQVHDMIDWTYKCLSLGGYTVDCPHRERLGYGGDSGTSMEMGMLDFQTGPFYAKWTADWRDAQNEEGDLPHTAPFSHQAGGGPVWSGFCITLPWQIYLNYGDKQPLEEGWPVMKKWLAFIDTKMDDGILKPFVGIGASTAKWSFLGDWVPPGREQHSDRVDDRSTLFFNNCYLVYCLQIAAKIGHILGDDAQAAIYEKRAEALAARLHKQFLNADGATYANGEQTYLVMPLLFGITPKDFAPKVDAALEHDIKVICNGHLNTGMHGNYYMTKYLIDQKRNDLLALMYTKEDYPSFGYMIKEGATTIWEEWDGEHSQIHNTLISVGLWFTEGLGGIRYDEKAPGFKHFLASPGVESGLEQVDASLMTGYGKIVSAWQVKDNTLTWELTVPPNTTASVSIPTTSLDAVRESGKPVTSQTGISQPTFAKNVFHCEVTSGTYHFTSSLP